MSNKHLYIFVLVLFSNWTAGQCLSSDFLASAVKMKKPDLIKNLLKEEWHLLYSNEFDELIVNEVKFNAELSSWKSQVGLIKIYFLETDYDDNVVIILDIDKFCQDELDALPSNVNIRRGQTIRLCDKDLLSHIDSIKKKILKEQEIAERKKLEEQLRLIAEEKERQRLIELQAKKLEEDRSNLHADITEKFKEKSYKVILDLLESINGSNLLISSKYNEYYTAALEGYFEQLVETSENLVKVENMQAALNLWGDLSSEYKLNKALTQKVNGELIKIKRVAFLKERPSKLYAADRFSLKEDLDEIMLNEILRYKGFGDLVDDFKVDIHWSSDYMGKNNTTIEQAPTKPLSVLIENRLNEIELPTIDGYNVNVIQTFTYNFSCGQNFVECRYGDSLVFSDTYGPEENAIRNWLYNKPKGKYLFAVKKIRMNSVESYSVEFEKYENPKIKATKKIALIYPAIGKDILSRIFQGTAIGGVLLEISSKRFYKDYLDNPTNGDLYQQANLYHQASLVSAGVAAVSYAGIIAMANSSVKEMKEKDKATNEKYRNVTIRQR